MLRMESCVDVLPTLNLHIEFRTSQHCHCSGNVATAIPRAHVSFGQRQDAEGEDTLYMIPYNVPFLKSFTRPYTSLAVL